MVERKSGNKYEMELRDFALAYPESHEDFPWDHRAIKVRKKIFVSMGSEEELSMSVKLPESHMEALTMPFTEPTHYGMGKYGWVTARFGLRKKPPMELLKDWIDESYRAVAPKKLVKMLDEEGEE